MRHDAALCTTMQHYAELFNTKQHYTTGNGSDLFQKKSEDVLRLISRKDTSDIFQVVKGVLIIRLKSRGDKYKSQIYKDEFRQEKSADL